MVLVWFPNSSLQQVRQPSLLSPVEEDTPKIRDMTGTVFIQGPSIVLPLWRCIMFNDSYLRACMFLGCGFLIHLSNRSDSPRFRAPWKKIRQQYGTQQEPSLFKGHPLSCQYGAYFELSFLGCGVLIHLSNRSDSPRFRAPWKKIRQKYDIQQEPSLFKGHPLSCQ